MATPADPNKALIADSQAVEAAQPGFGLTRDKFAEVYDGFTISGATINVANGRVTSISYSEGGSSR